MARCACIDIGSNTTRLLVAEGDGPRPRELLAERAFTRLGSARDRHGEIAEQKVAELAAVVARQAAVARAMGAGEPRIVATSAVRGALNAAALCAAVEAACGIEPEILSGEDEARLAFSGAIGMLPSPPPGIVGVVDVGGGSTELVVGTVAEGVTWSVSLPLGSSGVTDSDLPSDPPSAAELLRLRATLAQAFAAVDAPRPVGRLRRRRQRDLAAAARRQRPELREPDTRPAGARHPPVARGRAARSACMPSARGCCPPGCCCSTRRRGRWARRCSSPAVACAKGSSSSSSRGSRRPHSTVHMLMTRRGLPRSLLRIAAR